MINVLISISKLSLILCLAGCAAGGSSGWSSMTYPTACNLSIIPSEPPCLSIVSQGDGFKYRAGFLACRQSMLNYTDALDVHYRCADEKLKDIFDGIVKQVTATYNCYVGYFGRTEEGDPSIECPPVDLPRNVPTSYEVDGVEHDFGVPWCIATKSRRPFAMRKAYELDDCREQVEIFIGESTLLTHISLSSLRVVSAQKQYETYLSNLRQVLDRKANDAISKFNCIAHGGKLCI